MAIFNGGPRGDTFPADDGDNKGDDVITGNAGNDKLDGGPGDDRIYGGEDEDKLTGGPGDDMLDGGDGDDELDGGPDDDWLRGGKGADMLVGGLGTDVANYYESDAPVTVNLATDDGAGDPPATAKGGTAEGDTLTGIENVQGSMYADMITGDSATGESNDLFGWLGNDTLTGGAGNDKLRGHMGDDTLTGGDGDDWIRGGEGADVIDGGGHVTTGDDAMGDTVSYVGAAGVTVDLSDDSNNAGGQAEGDTITNVENVRGTRHDDVLTGTEAEANKLYGNDGNDMLYGLGGDDELYGGKGDDLLVGGAGADVLDGGEGNDTASYADSNDAVTVDLSDDGNNAAGDAAGDTLTNIENLTGSDKGDDLTGDKGINVLDGGKGDDMLDGGAGADVLKGGSGNDTADYSDSMMAVMVDLAAGTGMGGDAEGDTLDDIENVTGSGKDDTLYGDVRKNVLDGGDGADMLRGGAGADTIDGGTGVDGDGKEHADTVNYYDSTDGVELTLADGTADSAAGKGGTAAGDILRNIENVQGSMHNDDITGNNAANDLFGWLGDDKLDGGAEADKLRGHQGDDVLIGGAGDDWLRGGAGADKLYGGTLDGDGEHTDSGTMDTASYVGSAGVTVDLSDSDNNEGGQAEGDELFGIENVEGTKQADELTGDENANRLEGNAGDDVLDGDSGDDVLVGGAGTDEMDGGSGTDTASYAASKMGVMVDLDEGTGMGGDAEGDTLESIEKVIGSDHDDVLYGASGPQTLEGGKGNDMLRGGGGADVLTGGDGTDTVNYYDSNDGVTVDLGSTGAQSGGDAQGDTITDVENVQGSEDKDELTARDDVGSDLFGWKGDDTLTGGAGNDRLRGHMGDDTIDGMGGDDWIRGGEGADVIDGGTHDTGDDGKGDTVSYVGAAGVTVNLAGGIDHDDDDTTNDVHGQGGQAQGDTLTNVENVSGTKNDDKITGDGEANILTGGMGADMLDGGDGTDTANYADSMMGGVWVSLALDDDGNPMTGKGGTAEGDTLKNIENVIGSDHDDMLIGGDGDNMLTGGAGDDTLKGGLGEDMLFGGLGHDTLVGGKGNDVLRGGEGNDVLDGCETGEDKLYGEEGNDWLRGRAEADVLDGGAGTDTANYGESIAGVTVDLGSTGAQSGGSAEGDTFTSIENIEGSDHDDMLTGDGEANMLDGGMGKDTLVGGGGADMLVGGAGDDTLTGGAGADKFVFGMGDGEDTVTDFTDGVDMIDLTAFGLEGFGDVAATAADGGVSIDLSAMGGGTIMLADFALADLDASDFMFS